MKKIFILILALTFSINIFSQDSFEMNYGCYKEYEQNENKIITTQIGKVKAKFNVGINKDIVLIINEKKLFFKRTKESLLKETKNGNKYQVMFTEFDGVECIFHYFDNYQLKLINGNTIFVYDCPEKPISFEEKIYIIKSDRAYFHNEDNFKSKRKAYLIAGQSIIAEKESNNYIYTEYQNKNKKVTKGWISKKTLAIKPILPNHKVQKKIDTRNTNQPQTLDYSAEKIQIVLTRKNGERISKSIYGKNVAIFKNPNSKSMKIWFLNNKNKSSIFDLIFISEKEMNGQIGMTMRNSTNGELLYVFENIQTKGTIWLAFTEYMEKGEILSFEIDDIKIKNE